MSVLLDKGSDIFEIKYKPLDLDVIWHSPRGYRKPSEHVQTLATDDGAFLDLYGGGWNDIFPNYGHASGNRGARWGLHGESSNLPWNCVICNQGNQATAKLSAECIRYPLRATKYINLDRDQSIISITEEIQNTGEQEVELSWAQHIAFGQPFVSEHLAVEIPAVRGRTHTSEVKQERLARNREFNWPIAPGLDGRPVDLRRIPADTERLQDDFILTELKESRYQLYNSRLNLGVEVTWNSDVFRYLWYWLSWGALDYPWFGKARVLALEPVTGTEDTGLEDNIKTSKALTLSPSATLRGRITMRLFTQRTPNVQ